MFKKSHYLSVGEQSTIIVFLGEFIFGLSNLIAE